MMAYVTGTLGDSLYGEFVLGATSPVPTPGAAWVFGFGLIGLIGIASKDVTKYRSHK